MALPPLSGMVGGEHGGPGAGRVPRREQVGRRLTVPVGMKPPVTVAVSEIERADRPAGEGVVAMVGVAWTMVTGSARSRS